MHSDQNHKYATTVTYHFSMLKVITYLTYLKTAQKYFRQLNDINH